MKFKVISSNKYSMCLESIEPIGVMPASLLKSGMVFTTGERIVSMLDYNEVGVDRIVSGPGTILEIDSETSEKAFRYNSGKPDWSLVHFESLIPLVRGLEYGCKKYSRDNWKRGMDKGDILASMMRHIVALIDGKEIDEESGLGHISGIMCNAMFYSYYSNNHDQTRTPEHPTQKDPSL